MSDKITDANTALDSSNQAAVGSAAPKDAMADSSTAETATQQGAKAEPTMADAILDQFKKSTTSETPTEGEAEKGSGSENEQDAEGKTAEKVEEADTEKEEGVGEDKPKESEEERGPVPYERFQEVVHERQQIKQELEVVKPKVENYDRISTYCEQAGITPEQFNQALEIQAMLNTNPGEALKRLAPIIEQLQGISGEKLPSDLQKAVDDGDITLAYAKRLAQSEAQRQLGEVSSKAAMQRQQQEQQKQFQQGLASAAQTWEQGKRSSDPDYAPKAKADDPDGKWEMCRHVFTAMLHQTDQQGRLLNPIRSPQDMATLMESAYKQVNASFTRLRAKTPTRRVMSSNSSSRVNNKSIEEAGTMSEAIQIALAQHG